MENTIFDKVTNEAVARIISLTFVDLKGTVPSPTIDKVQEQVNIHLSNVAMSDGTTFSNIVRVLSTRCDGTVESFDKALEYCDHARYQLLEIARMLSPIVIQSVRALDQFQAEADQILFTLQEQITNKLTQDHTQANFEIIPAELGIMDDPDRLSVAYSVADQYVPRQDLVYRAHEYRMFANNIPFHVLTADQKAELNKFLVEHDLYNETLRQALSTNIADNYMFPEVIANPKAYSDYLTTLWDYGMELKSLLVALPPEEKPDEDILDNINGFISRLSLAVKWGHYAIDHHHKNSLIAGHDLSTIYVYPWSYETLTEDDSKEEIVKDFVRSKIIQSVKSPAGGYSVNDVMNSRRSVGNILSEYRRKVVLSQKEHTESTVKTVVRENLGNLNPTDTLKIINDLCANSDATLTDILEALIRNSNDYYLNALYTATNDQEYTSTNPNEDRANVVLSFLIKVAKDKIVAPVR